MRFDAAVRAALANLEADHLLRTPRVSSGPHGPETVVDGRRVLDFCSNDYLGLAGDARLAAAARQALETHGVGAPSSRHISGTTDLHRAAEVRLAAFTGHPRALLYASGYAANAGAIPALCHAGTTIYSDALNHASLIDGCRLSGARLRIYRHLDLDHLAALIGSDRETGRGEVPGLVVTETVFSMEGDLAPLAELRALCDRFELGLYVDEAHALGVLGPRGAGACAAASVIPDVLIGTLGKAFGASGAFAAGRLDTVALLENRSRTHVFSTAAPPLLAAVALHACDIVEGADDARRALLGHAETLRRSLGSSGRTPERGDSAIVPYRIGEPEEAVRCSAELFERGFFVHAIRPPTVPSGTSRLRITPMATHTPDQVDRLARAIVDLNHT